MYQPAAFSVTDLDRLHALIRCYPLASVIAHDGQRFEANLIPLQLSSDGSSLQGHIARANPLVQLLTVPKPALALFLGPNAYISPTFYASKATNPNAVPTWNYTAVEAQGQLRLLDDPVWLVTHLSELTNEREPESSLKTTQPAWQISDASPEFIERLSQHIIGVELSIESLTGKSKLSQNRPLADQQSVVAALEALGQCDEAAQMRAGLA